MKAETRADAMAPTAAVPHRQHLVIGAVRTASSRTGLVLVVLAGESWCGASDWRDRSVISAKGAVRPGVGESRYVRLPASRNPACKRPSPSRFSVRRENMEAEVHSRNRIREEIDVGPCTMVVIHIGRDHRYRAAGPAAR